MKTVFLLVLCSTMIGMEPEIIQEEIMTIPKVAIDLIKQFEGLRLKSYQDSAGYFTVGWGHKNATPPPCDDCTVFTADQAENVLNTDLEHVLSQIQGHIGVDLTDNQLAALLSFAFNLGPNALINSTLLKKLNSGDTQGAADQFLAWDRAGGVVIPGLARRRAAEQKLFLTPDTEGTTDVIAGN